MTYVWYLTPTHYDKALSNGINAKALENRVREYGWDIERAINEPLHGQKLKSILTNEILETIDKNNITLNAFTKRVFNLGWNIEKSMTSPTMSRTEAINCAIDKRRIISKEQYNIAMENGINKIALRKRVYRGWSIGKSISTPLFTKRERARSGNFFKNMQVGYKIKGQ